MNKKRILIVDGTNILIRSMSVSQRVKNVNTYYLFFKEIYNAYKVFNPNLCFISFDGQKNSIKRKLLFSEYKQNRGKVNKQHTKQFQQGIYQLLKYLPIITLRINGIQSDDTIAHIIRSNKNIKSMIVSSDKDFYQLINEDVIVWDCNKKIKITQKYIKEKYSIHPKNFIILKCLLGDSSDNISGIPGLGKKRIIKHFGQVLKNQYPINGDIQKFIQYCKNNLIKSDYHVIINNKKQDLKLFYKIMNLNQGLYSSQLLDLILIINNKIKDMNYKPIQFLKQLKKFNLDIKKINQFKPLVLKLKASLKWRNDEL